MKKLTQLIGGGSLVCAAALSLCAPVAASAAPAADATATPKTAQVSTASLEAAATGDRFVGPFITHKLNPLNDALDVWSAIRANAIGDRIAPLATNKGPSPSSSVDVRDAPE